MKRLIGFILLFAMLMCFASAQGQNLLLNGDFEQVEENGMPSTWTAVSYRSQLGYSFFRCDTTHVHSGSQSALIDNTASNDSRLIVSIDVEPSSLYRFSGYVWVEGADGKGNGANFALEDIICVSDCIKKDTDGWEYLEWYGETAVDQKKVTIGIRMGGYGRESAGRAWFDDIVFEKIDSLPEGICADPWYSETTEAGDNPGKSMLPERVGLILLLVLLFIPVLLLLIRAYDRNLIRMYSRNGGQKAVVVFALLFVFAVVLRLTLAARIPGYSVDINCFTAWSMKIASSGPSAFYEEGYFCDYPPGCILFLAPIGFFLNQFGYQSTASLVMLKSLPIVFDILSALVLAWLGKRENKRYEGMLLALLYLLSPAVLVTGSCWGQMDSLTAFTLMIAVLFASKRRWSVALPSYVLSVLIKPQALLAGPIGLIWLIRCLISDKGSRKDTLKKILIGLGASFGIALVICCPFMIGQEKPIQWLLSLYGGTLSSYEYASINTANLYYLAGGNWVSVQNSVPSVLGLGVSFVLIACAFSLLLLPKSADQPKKNRLPQCILFLAAGLYALLCTLAPLSYAFFGYGMMAFVYLYAVLCVCRHSDGKQLLFQIGLLLCGIYCLSIKVHERYMFSALLLFAGAYLMTGDKRILILFGGFSVTTALNTGLVLNNSILYGAASGHLNSDTAALNILLCIANILLTGYGGFLGYDGLRKSPVKPGKAFFKPKASVQPEAPAWPANPHLRLRPMDYLIMLGTTLLYASLCFSNLGSTVAPQTSWVSLSGEDEVVLRLEKNTDFRVLYYCGVSYQNFALCVSEDGVTWSEPYPCRMSESLCFRWNYLLEPDDSSDDEELSFTEDPANIITLHGQYLKVQALSPGLNLWEIVARTEDGMTIPMVVESAALSRDHLLGESYSPDHLVDESNTCQGEPGWFTGTYFDEIYHVRTAYEHLTGATPYETTHPPLGKLLIACGIAIFGMTPFGWRFMGTFLGTLMLPVLYILAMQITRKRTAAVVSIGALALDLMHFAQTRIGTIDTYPLFFILLSYLFLVRYMQTPYRNIDDKPFFSRNYLSALGRLSLCGLCMGLSIASKWTGIYSAVGLAVLFFFDLIRRIRESFPADGRISVGKQLLRPFITCLFCVVFFIAVPAVIYYLSYIPYLAPTGSVTVEKIISVQEHILAYHSQPGLGMDHPFQSPWYEWPLILKPMWYAQDHYEPGGFASTIFCMGNPWVFYLGLAAILTVLVMFAAGILPRRHQLPVLVRDANNRMTLLVVSVGFLAQYLPWILVPRSMYIYHYFASVPFIILATGFLISLLPKTQTRWIVTAAYIAGALVFFAIFFPYASGLLTSIDLLDQIRSIPALLYHYRHFVLYY